MQREDGMAINTFAQLRGNLAQTRSAHAHLCYSSPHLCQYCCVDGTGWRRAHPRPCEIFSYADITCTHRKFVPLLRAFVHGAMLQKIKRMIITFAFSWGGYALIWPHSGSFFFAFMLLWSWLQMLAEL